MPAPISWLGFCDRMMGLGWSLWSGYSRSGEGPAPEGGYLGRWVRWPGAPLEAPAGLSTTDALRWFRDYGKGGRDV